VRFCEKQAGQIDAEGSGAIDSPLMDRWIIGVAIVIALYIAVRLVLRHYFPPDT
jgi:hypothetical protein